MKQARHLTEWRRQALLEHTVAPDRLTLTGDLVHVRPQLRLVPLHPELSTSPALLIVRAHAHDCRRKQVAPQGCSPHAIDPVVQLHYPPRCSMTAGGSGWP